MEQTIVGPTHYRLRDVHEQYGIVVRLDKYYPVKRTPKGYWLRGEYAPILNGKTTLHNIGISNITDLLSFADGESINNPVREGVVFKCVTNGDISFKAISNKFLLKGGD